MTDGQTVAGVRIGNVWIDNVTRSDVVARIGAAMSRGHPLTMFYVNAHSVRLASQDHAFALALEQADLRICDGYGPWIASRILGRPLRERMTPPDWVDAALATLPHGSRVFLLGDDEQVVRRAAARTQERCANLGPIGWHHGFFPLHDAEADRVVERIRAFGPDVLLVGMGQPRQEAWINQYGRATGAAATLAVGALYQWWSGEERRAPAWVTGSGLEWLARLIRHPIRHGDRYLVGLPAFGLIILRSRLMKSEPYRSARAP